MTDYHVQCTLVKGAAKQVSWIPAKFAKAGRPIKLKEGDEWEDGWIVEHVGSKMLTADVMARQNDHKNMKKVTDI